MTQTLWDHMAGGAATVCRCWALERADGAVLGFTDHDTDLNFEGVVFRAESGLTAKALEQATGLSVDNSEVWGALSHAGIREADVLAGRFDGAKVRAWLVNWADTHQRVVQFAGTIGEVRRSGGAFHAELRGLAEALNHPQGRMYQAGCGADLGDGACGIDLRHPGYALETAVQQVADRRAFRFDTLGGFAGGWFERGRFRVLSGAANGLTGMVKHDRQTGAGREIELWQALGADIAPGDLVRIEAGCDKRAETCCNKFANFLNFRGFPHIPGEDWLIAFPHRAGNRA